MTHGDFSAAIRRDYFPYFTQGKTITVTGFEVYDKDAATLTPCNNQLIVLDGNEAYPLTIPNLPTHAEAFLIIRYVIGSP